jgi:hypothetical protein
MRTFNVVTSQHRPYYDLIGKDCISTFLKHWPKEVSLDLWAENFVPDILDSRLRIKDFEKINPRFKNFVTLIKSKTKNKKILSREKFWLKGHVVLSAMEECTSDVFVWIDSDVLTHNDISIEYLNSLIPEDTLSVDIPAGGKAKGKEVESGFFALNMKHPNAKSVIEYYKKCHTTTDILSVNRCLETAVWWNAVENEKSKGAKIKHLPTAQDSLMPFMSTELSQYLRHWVAKINKKNYEIGSREKTLEEKVN